MNSPTVKTNLGGTTGSTAPSITFTLMTNLAGINPGKEYWLDEEGSLQKEIHGERRRLKATRMDQTLESIAELIRSAGPEQHLVSGIATVPEAIAVSSKKLLQHQKNGESHDVETGMPLIGFSDSDLQRRASPALMLIDSDGKQPISAMDQLSEAIPGIEKYQHIVASSSSAFITSVDGKISTGAKGTHTVFAVKDGTDIPRALDVIHKRLLLAGHGQSRLSSSGAFLERSAVDRQLRVPSQPIFMRATLRDGLVQNKQVEFCDGIPLLDTRSIVQPLTPAEESAFATNVAEARLAMLGESTEVRRHYIETRADDMVKRSERKLDKSAALAALATSLEGGNLGPDYVIYLAENKTVAVRDILANAKDFHGVNCRDPEEPDYGSCSVAKIYSDQARPVIHSFAHGGRTFILQQSADAQHDFDLDAVLAKIETNERQKIEAERGDAVLAVWLGAKICTGKTEVPIIDCVKVDGDMSFSQAPADSVATDLLCARLGLNVEKSSLAIGDDTPGDAYMNCGIGLRYRLNGQCIHLKLSLAATESILQAWSSTNRDACLRGWASLVAEFGNVESEDDPAFAVIVKYANSLLKLGAIKVGRDMLTQALISQAANEVELHEASRPKLYFPPTTDSDPEEIEAQRVRVLLAEQATLLAAAGDLPQCANLPERAYETCRKHLGVVGESTIFDATIVSACSPMFGSGKLILSLIVNGPSASGKSFTSQAALSLIPDNRKFMATSLSEKALFNLQADAVEGKVFVLFEANAMMDPDSPLTMACRTLLTEGRISYHTVEDVQRDDGTIGKQTVLREVSGPTSLITTTTRIFLDPELETRALMLETDDSESQTRSILQNRIIDIETGEDIERGIPDKELAKWHAYFEWVALQPNRVAIPFWSAVVGEATAEMVPMRRDIMKLQAVIKVHALLHQNLRERNDLGAVIATLDDYEFARRLVLPTLQREVGGGDVDIGVQEFITGIRALVGEQEKSKKQFHNSANWILHPDLSELNITYTQLSKQLKMHRSTVQRRLQKAIKAGLIENHEERSKKQMRLALVENPRAGVLLPGSERIRQAVEANKIGIGAMAVI